MVCHALVAWLSHSRGALPWLAPHAADPLEKQGNKNTEKYEQIGFSRIFDVFGPFWSIFDVLEARDLFKKIPGGDVLDFH